jgi:hypothetical protein
MRTSQQCCAAPEKSAACLRAHKSAFDINA